MDATERYRLATAFVRYQWRDRYDPDTRACIKRVLYLRRLHDRRDQRGGIK